MMPAQEGKTSGENQRPNYGLEFETSSPKPGHLEKDFEFETLDSSAVLTAPVGAKLIDWVRGACSTLEQMVEEDPAGPEICGYMDGVRIINRLKKKMEADVDLYCFGQGSSVCPNNGACTMMDSSASSSSQEVDDFQGDAKGSSASGPTSRK